MFIITPDNTVIGLDEIRFYPDAFTRENIDLAWSKTSHPVANGFTKSDGIFRNPKRVALSGCVAGQSLNKQGVDPFENADDRTLAACNMIEAMGDARDCITVITGSGKVHQNMVLVGAPMDYQIGGVLAFDLLFEELQTFSISETFDAVLGQTVNIGEVSTTTGQPLIAPDGSEIVPQTDFSNSLDTCELICGQAIASCLDDCYSEQLAEFGL